MDHFPELVYSTYVDGELPEAERRRVKEHLRRCGVCQRFVASLEAENRVLMQAFHETPSESAAAVRGIGRSLLLTALSAIVVAIGLDRVVVYAERIAPGVGSGANWFSLEWLQSLFFSNAFDLVREGPAMLNAVVTVVGMLVLGAVVIALLRHFSTRNPMSLAMLASLLLMVGAPRPAAAMETRSGSVVRVGAKETVNQSLTVTSQTVDVEGTVNGNVIGAGGRLVIHGVVKGDVFWWGHELEVAGTVEGGVYTWSGSVLISGHVNRSVYSWAGAIEIAGPGRVDGDLITGTGGVRLEGTVARDINAWAGTFDLDGTVGRDLDVHTNLLTVVGTAHIGGNLTAHVEKRDQVDVESGASVAGKTDIIVKPNTSSKYRQPKFYFWQAIWLAGAFILALLLNLFAPVLFATRLESGGTLLWSILFGFLALVAIPAGAVVAAITMVGIPVAVLALGLGLGGLWAAKVFVAAAIGRILLGARRPDPPPFALALIVGLLPIFIAINLPYVGGWMTFLVILIGLGLATMGISAELRRRRAAV